MANELLPMKKFTSCLIAVVLILVLLSCSKRNSPPPTPPPPVINIQPPPAFGFYVVGYFPSYRMVAEYPDQVFKMCSVINYAFFGVNTLGVLDMGNLLKFDSVYQKAKANGAKVFISINNAANFKTMAATSEGRLNFVKDVMIKVRQLKLDGVDIDWEYPSAGDGTHETYALLMKQLSDSLHVNGKYYLTAAITPGIYSGNIRDGIKTEVFTYVDFFNIMAYDDFTTDPLYPFKQHSSMATATKSLDYWLNTRSMPASKCVLGIPAYGRPSGITQSGTVLSYKTILSQGGSPQSDSAKVSAGGFTNYTIYYNGQLTVKKKTAFAKQIANGAMLWEIGHDAINQNSLLKAVCDTIGRSY